MEENDHKHLLEERRFIDYLMTFLHSVLYELDSIVTRLDRETFSERTTRREEVNKRTKKPIIKIETRPMTVQEIQAAIGQNNLRFTLRRLREMLSFVNNLSVGIYQVVEIVRALPDKNDYFFVRLSEYASGMPSYEGISIISCAINEIDRPGYGKPEKYNQVYYLIVRCAIQLLEYLGY